MIDDYVYLDFGAATAALMRAGKEDICLRPAFAWSRTGIRLQDGVLLIEKWRSDLTSQPSIHVDICWHGVDALTDEDLLAADWVTDKYFTVSSPDAARSHPIPRARPRYIPASPLPPYTVLSTGDLPREPFLHRRLVSVGPPLPRQGSFGPALVRARSGLAEQHKYHREMMRRQSLDSDCSPCGLAARARMPAALPLRAPAPSGVGLAVVTRPCWSLLRWLAFDFTGQLRRFDIGPSGALGWGHAFRSDSYLGPDDVESSDWIVLEGARALAVWEACGPCEQQLPPLHPLVLGRLGQQP